MVSMHLGIDIGGTNVKFGIINSNFELLEFNTTKLPRFLNQRELFEWIVKEIQEILTKLPEVATIGIGYPGVINQDGLILVSPNISQFVGFNLKENLENRVGRKISIDNDANVAAIAELKCGAGLELNNFIYITLGTGVGGAIVINREIFRGSNFGAGEIGHMIINPFDEIKEEIPFRTGVLEEYLGKEAIIKTAKNLSRKFEKSPIVINSLFDVAHISDYADLGDQLSIETMKLSGYYLGLAIVSVANLLDIPNFILGGGIANSSELFYKSALETARQRVLPQIAGQLKVSKSQFVEKSGIIGSAIYGIKDSI